MRRSKFLTLEQRLWLFTSTRMPRWKVPGSPVSWIATCLVRVKIKQVDRLGNLVGEGSAERRLAGAWGAMDQGQPGSAHLSTLTLSLPELLPSRFPSPGEGPHGGVPIQGWSLCWPASSPSSPPRRSATPCEDAMTNHSLQKRRTDHKPQSSALGRTIRL